ncbi:hypothetical protein [Collinsella intestinalis]|uniref:hypothetical protein n=1 Tax=Collinsella intestinalis TaxID=147207 RepID=UPI0019597FEC|nr:hypothetical protein [Collinsella intestinalis]MBM6682727.1 hypothetical protein [Collinsella intestinalis]
MKRGLRLGIDLFIEDGAYTTVAAAVTMLVTLTLLFSAITAAWTLSRSGEVQVAADATALAGSNVVASYRTAATVADAAVLSMGLAGLCTTGAGLVGMLVPGAQAAAGETVQTGIRMLELRNKLAASASRGLSALESALPYLVAANAARTCTAQGSEQVSYTGTALAVPRDSASEFPALEGEGIPTEGLSQASDELGAAAERLAEASAATEEAKRAAWLADCGSDGANMQERAARLSGLSARENPDYASSITWEPQVGLDRARAYYRWRLAHNEPEGPGTEAAADAAARSAFYRFALEELEAARIEEADGRVVSTVPLLPRNTDDVRATSLYTEAVWPSTVEAEGLTLHYSAACPGAAGAAGPALSLAATENGTARECPTCRFGVGDVGRAPAASTSIENGFEYHLRAFTLALNEYISCRDRELELEQEVRQEAEGASDAFEAALGTLAGKRPHIAPPGRDGCVGFAVTGEVTTPEELESAFAPGGMLTACGAVAGSVLAPDPATEENNVLADFFSTIASRTSGGGAAGLIDDVMGLWGRLLVTYGNAADGLAGVMDDLLGGLSSLGMGSIASWLSNQVSGAVHALGLEPVDLTLMKPVLTDSANVIARSGSSGLSDVQSALRSLPVGSTDPAAMMQALSYEVGETLSGATFTLAEIPLPGGGSIPLTIQVQDLMGGELP